MYFNNMQNNSMNKIIIQHHLEIYQIKNNLQNNKIQQYKYSQYMVNLRHYFKIKIYFSKINKY